MRAILTLTLFIFIFSMCGPDEKQELKPSTMIVDESHLFTDEDSGQARDELLDHGGINSSQVKEEPLVITKKVEKVIEKKKKVEEKQKESSANKELSCEEMLIKFRTAIGKLEQDISDVNADKIISEIENDPFVRTCKENNKDFKAAYDKAERVLNKLYE